MIDEDLIEKALYYQKKFGFKLTPGTKGYNDATDAFRHAFMQAYLSQKYTKPLAYLIGTEHELPYHKPKNMSNEQWISERNMDLHNNAIGRKVFSEVYSNLDKVKGITQKGIEDWMAYKIYERMKNGELITKPQVHNNKKRIFTDKEIINMKNDEFLKNSKLIDEAINNKTVYTEEQARQEVLNGGLIWVNEYKRADGTKVSGYYREA